MSNPTIKKRVCDRCGKEFFETYREWLCKDCMNDLGWEYTPKTNADHIRSMTDEELADCISENCINDFCFIVCGGDCKAMATFNRTSEQVCRDIVTDWLKQPYKEV